MRDQLTEKVENLVVPLLETLSAELVELQIKHTRNIVVVDIVADKAKGGITIRECTLINKKVFRALEENQWFGEDYVVEVASPGLDRPLKTQKDFMRIIGREVRFHLLDMIDGKVEHMGEVKNVEEEQVLIKRKDKIIAIPLKVISKAVQVIK